MPHPPQLPKPGAAENPGTGNVGPQRNLFPVFLQSHPDSARNLDRCLSRCSVQGRGLYRVDTLPLPKDSLFRGGPQDKSHPEVFVVIPREDGWGASEGGSAPPPRPPGAPLPRPGAGPLSRTWSSSSHRARHTPSPPTALRPRGS